MRLDHCVPIELINHEQYLRVLSGLQQKTAYIMLVQVDEENEREPILAKALSCMELIKKSHVGQWPGTIRRGQKAPQYLFHANHQFFKFLREFPSFFFNRRDQWGCDMVEQTDFGQDDIAFLDQQRRMLLYTTTHEGYAYVAPDFVENR